MPVGLLGIDWDAAAQTVTLRYAPPKAAIVFTAADIPSSMTTTAQMQSWCDSNLQTFMVARGLKGFIKAKIWSAGPPVQMSIAVADTQAALNASTWPTVTPPSG